MPSNVISPAERPSVVHSQARVLFVIAVTLIMTSPVAADKRPDLPGIEWDASGKLVVGGNVFSSWEEYARSDFFRTHRLRCGCGAVTPTAAPFGPTDCGLNNTNASPIYDPTVTYRIPVVVHVIQRTDGTGFLNAAIVQSQIDILNEDFSAIAGSNGAAGADTGIEFYLAATDPLGNVTTGITYSTNNMWFNDNGNYWNSLAWDPQRYLNIYTNSADGALGYVPYLPQEGPAGSNSDRVVILYSTFGANAPMAPYNLGRTTTHEVGHYLGLWHTFDNGCGSAANCSTTGDRICDTPPQQFDTFGCPSSASSCGTPDPIHNYMDYSDDVCMDNFTVDQTRRMRCTLENYRPLLFQPVTTAVTFRRGDTNGDSALDISDAVTVLVVLFGGGSAPCQNALDANDDESVNVADAVFLLQALFGTGPLPLGPSPNCGPDPTSGPLTCATSSACP